jgi:O-antigen/teichoic acid export membrane protein
MSQSASFRKVAKGGALFTAGSFSATLLHFLTGIVVIRILDRSDYGLISLAMTGVVMLSMLSTLGLKTAIPRFLAKYRARGDTALVSEVSATGFAAAFSLSMACAALLYGQAEMAARAFHKPELSAVFEVLALMLPPIALMDILTAIFQGIENARAKVLFQDIGLNLLRLALLVLLVLVGYGFWEVLWIYVISAWLIMALYLGYAMRALHGTLRLQLSYAVAKDLVWFSLPLLGINIMNNVMTWTPMLMLGYLKPAAEVGLFSAPLRLASIIPVALAGMTFLYLPVAAKLTAQGGIEDVQELYRSTTKWAFLLTLPVLLYFMIDAEFVVTLLFGAPYADAAGVLRVMVLGLAIHTFVGPNGITLISLGNTRTPFVASLIVAIAAVVLCLLFVPRHGALGAALGTAVARSLSNVYLSVALYRKFAIHPLVSSYLKPVLLATVGAIGGAILLNSAGGNNIVSHLILFLAITGLTLISPLFTRTLSHADMDLLGSVEQRIAGDTRITERVRQWLDMPSTSRKRGGG